MEITEPTAPDAIAQPVIMVNFPILVRKIRIAMKTNRSVYRTRHSFRCIDDFHSHSPLLSCQLAPLLLNIHLSLYYSLKTYFLPQKYRITLS